ncbi:MAG: globin [Acidimicrobiia bacterium]
MTDESVQLGGGPAPSVYDLVGGRPFFDGLVDRFYERVETDPVLRPLYPEDLEPGKAHLAGFLSQYWGGGTAHYSDERGHPRLRMRHAPYPIGPAERDAWVHAMCAALDEAALAPELDAPMRDYLVGAADFMMNQ